jgi:hypothetical protein
LERAGISPKMAQVLARHSDIRLTLGVYTHVELHDQTAASRAPVEHHTSSQESPPRKSLPRWRRSPPGRSCPPRQGGREAFTNARLWECTPVWKAVVDTAWPSDGSPSPAGSLPNALHTLFTSRRRCHWPGPCLTGSSSARGTPRPANEPS